MPDHYLNLKGFNSVFDTTLYNELQDNVVEFLEWSLLQKGNYFNVTLNEENNNGDDYSRLRLSSSTNYASGQAWEGFRSNWVWQSGISYNPPPLVGHDTANPGISGIYVDDIFYSTSTSGEYAHKIDYYNGRVIFDDPIPTGSKIQAEYSYKYINVLYANSLPWITELQSKSLDIPQNFIENKGKFDLPIESRVQLPAIAVELVPKRTLRGYQLGGGQFVSTDILFHCLAEDEYTRNKLMDIISLQNDKTIFMFNSNILANSGLFPLDYMGCPVSGALEYPHLVDNYTKGPIRFKNATVQSMQLLNDFHAGIVRLTLESIEQAI